MALPLLNAEIRYARQIMHERHGADLIQALAMENHRGI
jgi:hypothetical protein